MLSEIGEISSAQGNGELPKTLASGSAPGESGVSISQLVFRGGAHFEVKLKQHLIGFNSKSRIHCRAADRFLSHNACDGSLHITPAGVDGAADTDDDVNAIVIAVKPDRLTLAAAESGALAARLIERFVGYDQWLYDLARRLTDQARHGYPDGAIFWNETAARFIDRLADRHTIGAKIASGGVLDVPSLDKIRDYIIAHLHEPLDVATLASMTHRSQFHFSRAFTRAVGVSPYRYVTGLRVRRAVELVRGGGCSFADVASQTGFADQAHLSRWVRRATGVTLTQLRS